MLEASTKVEPYLTKIREWTDSTEPEPEEGWDWPAPPWYTEYRIEGQMREDVLTRLGREPGDTCEVRMIQGVIEGGYSEYTVEHDYPIEVWVHEGRQSQKVFDNNEAYWRDDALAAFLKWLDGAR